MEKSENTDILGIALQDYFLENYSEDIITESTISEEDAMPLPYLFRNFSEMPDIEQEALSLCSGKVLDVGCGSGSHSLYLQNELHLDVTAIDISPGAVTVSKKRGVEKVYTKDLYNVEEPFDTILLLMNGIGICGLLENLNTFLQHLKSITKPKGQILIDSSDIKYMFDDDPDTLKELEYYYGEVTFVMKYKNQTSKPFDWLYLDFNRLKKAAEENDLSCELVKEGPHHDFLVRLKHR